MAWLSKKTKSSVPEDEASRIAQELYSKNVDLAHTNRTLSLLRTIDGLVLEPKNNVKDIVDGIAHAIIDNSSNLSVAIYTADQYDVNPRSMKLTGHALTGALNTLQPGDTPVFDAKIECTDEWFGARDLSKLVDVNDLGSVVNASFFANNFFSLRQWVKDTGVRSLYFIKLQAQNRLSGLMVIGLSEALTEVKLEQLEQLGRVGEAAGIALDNKLLTEKYQHVLKKLQMSNEKLKALDEAKDEFVSMASHQLRTPLTSIKGYISMVVEGDAGEINPTQKQMLGQALFSSQRMVYLISDLLNVSRLKTGKFVIEAKPTSLPEVVGTELNQLYDGANAKNITLSFDKPAKFPMLNLDEMKIRQVIMNFTDNAIYYTPSGGKITVSLKDKKDSVEFSVKDTGIGVPKAERHKLFAKFYRAENARKARPDGTGLGLFMAKKVIVAQGGSILFDSKEGKGSTFGFSFPKKRLEVVAESSPKA